MIEVLFIACADIILCIMAASLTFLTLYMLYYKGLISHYLVFVIKGCDQSPLL